MTPTRMSTRWNSSQVSAIAPPRSADGAERGTRIVVGQDLLPRVALLGHGTRRRLVHPDAVTVATPREAGHVAVDGHGEERALQRVVAHHAPELVAAEG